jgi:DNA-binding transcriptional LysR family regulator
VIAAGTASHTTSIGGTVELRTLRYFVTVAEELHFGRAAERLHIVQPAVSQQIARLERELGTRLLDRSPRQVALTAAGHRVLTAARDTLAAADLVLVAAGKPVNEVRIGTVSGLTSRLERGIDALRAQHPTFEAVLVDLPFAARVTALRRGELDMALARGVINEPGLRVLPSWSEPLHVVVSGQHPAAGRDKATIGELADYLLRLPSRQCDPPLHDTVTAALRDAGVRPKLGRPTGTTQNTIVEVGSDPRSWTLLSAEQIEATHSTRVWSMPLDPPIAVLGSVLTTSDKSQPCVTSAVATFRTAVAA